VIQIVITAGLGLGLRASIAANLAVIVLWIGIAQRLGREYVNQLRESLRDPRRARPDVAVGREADTRDVLQRTLREGGADERLAALDWIAANSVRVDEAISIEFDQPAGGTWRQWGAIGVVLEEASAGGPAIPIFLDQARRRR